MTEQDSSGDAAQTTAAPASTPGTPPTAGAAEEPDALGHVVEQDPLPDEQSSVGQPGEALEELLPALETTGHEGVDDALATLEEMAGTSVHDHVEVFDSVHQELRRTLDRAAEQ